MIAKLIQRRLYKEERRLGLSLDYLRHIARVPLPAFFKFAKIMPMANHLEGTAATPYYVARLVAAVHENCGRCVRSKSILQNATEQNGAQSVRRSTGISRCWVKI